MYVAVKNEWPWMIGQSYLYKNIVSLGETFLTNIMVSILTVKEKWTDDFPHINKLGITFNLVV